MKIWLIDHYGVPPKYYPLARPTIFAKKLTERGHDVKIIAASTVHNSDINLITDKSKNKEIIEDGVHYFLINCHKYNGNGIKRIFNMLEFAFKLLFECKELERPEVIISTSLTQFACISGILLARKYKCKKITQIADLWPETLVAYDVLKKNNIIVLFLRYLEKWMYVNSDRIIFLMEGAYDYIVEQGWDRIIPKEKISYINNGIDIKSFNDNKAKYKIDDEDLIDDRIFKVIYTGSIRKINNVGRILDIAKLTPNAKFLIWGDGDEKENLQKRIIEEDINNVVFKGKVDKKYVPYIVSKANINFAHNSSSPLFRFGISFNKMFDYLAAGKPILCDFESKYNPAIENKAGIEVIDNKARSIANAIENIAKMPKEEYDKLCKNVIETAYKYDFNNLTDKVLQTINSIR